MHVGGGRVISLERMPITDQQSLTGHSHVSTLRVRQGIVQKAGVELSTVTPGPHGLGSGHMALLKGHAQQDKVRFVIAWSLGV